MIHQLKTLCRFIPVLILLLAGTQHALAQKETISLDARNITVRELLNIIEKKSSYTFAYADADLPLERRVTIKAVNKPISSILREALPETSVKVQNKKILIARTPASEQKKEVKKQPETPTEEKKPGKGWNLKGIVVDDKGEPLIGATVMVKGTNLGASTDTDGKFIIRVASANPVLVARYVGYNPSETKATKGKDLKITLNSSSVNLNEVVVTALGITREQKSLGYAVTKVEGEDLNNTVSGNWLNALDGKVAGLSATGAGSGPNGSMRVVLRGDQSLNYGSNEALFVVDGVPINSGDAGTGSGGTYSNADSPVDFGNAASEINPEDVESVSILKGPAATALYGSRAANGAIVITTKSGRKTKGIGVTVNSSVTFEKAGYFPDFQTEYGPGNDNGFGQYGFWQFKDTPAPEGFTPTSVTSRYAFGEKFDASKLRNQYESYNWETGEYTLLPYVYADDWYTGIFQTGTTFKNSVTLTSNNGKGTSSRVSVTDTRNNWIMPNTGYANTSVSFSFNTKVSKWIKIQAKGNYLHKTSDNTPISGYSTSAPTYYIIWGTNNISMDSYKNEYFAGRCTKENYESNRYDGKSMVNRLGNTEPGNPYQQLYEATNSINKDRFYGNVLVQVSFPVKGLTLDLRAGTDFMTDFRQQKKPFRTPGYKSGFYREQNNRDNETNLDFMLKYVNNDLFSQRLGLNAAFGGNNMTRSVWRHSITLSKLGEEGVYNSTNLPTGENPREYNWRSRKVVNSFYGFLNASWDNTYFLDITARNDWSSALGRHNWSFFYPSVSASVLLDRVLNLQDKAPWINMLKMRGSWANVGNDTSPYTLVDSYTSSSTYPGSYELPGNRANYFIKPENVESYEVGIDSRFFMNRFGIDIAYYNSRTTNQIISAVTDPIIGSSSKKMNCGEIRNQGIEIALHGVPVRTRDFTWSIDINWARNWNKLVSLEDGWDPEIPYQQAQNIVGNGVNIYSYIGKEMGWLYGRGYERAPEGSFYMDENGNKVDCSGMKIVDPSTGLPILDQTTNKNFGKINPTWRGGMAMNFRYKDFTLGLNFTAQMGGHAYSLTHSMFAYQGKLKNSLPGRYDGLVVEGVNAVADSDGSITYQPNKTVTGSINSYYTLIYKRDFTEENVFKTDFLKLKELRLDYNLPARLCHKSKVFQGVSVGFYATNIFCITKFPLYDPEAGALVGTNVYSGVEAGALPMTRTYGVNVKLSF